MGSTDLAFVDTRSAMSVDIINRNRRRCQKTAPIDPRPSHLMDKRWTGRPAVNLFYIGHIKDKPVVCQSTAAQGRPTNAPPPTPLS